MLRLQQCSVTVHRLPHSPLAPALQRCAQRWHCANRWTVRAETTGASTEAAREPPSEREPRAEPSKLEQPAEPSKPETSNPKEDIVVQAEVIEPEAASSPSSSTTASTDVGSSTVQAHALEDAFEDEEDDLIASKELMKELADTKSFGTRGELLLIAQLAAMGMLLFPPLTLKGLVDFAATTFITAGFVFMAYSFFSLGRSLSPLAVPRKKHTLVTSGLYGYVRHPMYGGLLLAAIGLAILTRNETRLAITALLWWVLEAKVVLEERALTERYPEYAEYKANVKKFFPYFY